MPAPKIPSTSNYLKLQQGENTFRVLGDVIFGFRYFNKENKPVRTLLEPVSPSDLGSNKDGKPNTIVYFWAFPVWNYKEERVQIAEFHQKTILVPLEGLWNKGTWGELTQYDITITKKGSTLSDTEYTITPNPKEPISEKVKELYVSKKINLEALFTGQEPFNSDTPSTSNLKEPTGTPAGMKYPEGQIDPNDIPF